MPTARKRTVAKKTAAKKIAAKKTAAPRKTATEKAVEEALDKYKKEVAAEVEHYMDTGDLCNEEAVKIRRNLRLEQHLDLKTGLRLDLQFRGNGELTGGCGDAEGHADEIAKALLTILQKGVTIRCGDGATFTFGENAQVWEASIEPWD